MIILELLWIAIFILFVISRAYFESQKQHSTKLKRKAVPRHGRGSLPNLNTGKGHTLPPISPPPREPEPVAAKPAGVHRAKSNRPLSPSEEVQLAATLLAEGEDTEGTVSTEGGPKSILPVDGTMKTVGQQSTRYRPGRAAANPVVQGIIWAEILAPPRAMHPYRTLQKMGR